MALNMLLTYGLFVTVTLMSHGFADIPYYYEIPFCHDGIGDSDAVPFYEFEKPSQPFDESSDNRFPSAQVRLLRGQDIQDVSEMFSPSRRKRSIHLTEDEAKSSLEPIPNTKTIRIPSQFTPRLGRKVSSKRSQNLGCLDTNTQYAHVKTDNGFKPKLRTSESEGKLNLDIGNIMKTRLERMYPNALTHKQKRSEERINLNAGSGFTPRLGRSEERIFLGAGNGFTPRLGRSQPFFLNSGLSKLRRSEDSGSIKINAGNSFTPRLGRSDGHSKYILETFTPRLGRSAENKRISLNAGSAFTPRLGRSED